MRSVWAITESSRALPKEMELRELARFVRGIAAEAGGHVVSRLEKSPGDTAAFFTTLYAALSLGDDEPLMARAGPLLLGGEGIPPNLSWARGLAGGLMKPVDEIDRKALAALVSDRLGGEDLVILTALACRRGGGETWKTFRIEARGVLGRQDLDGNAVLLVNRLSQPRLPLASVDSL
jgi:hypothetical protein